MGAWGLGLFQNDDDADLACEFSSEAGIDTDNDNDEDSIDMSEDEHNAIIRDRLDSGILAKMVAKRWPDATNPAKISRGWGVTDSPDYQLVILGAWAMESGATLPDGLKAFMKRTYPGLGLQRHGRMQMESACDEYDAAPVLIYPRHEHLADTTRRAKYVDGTPYDFHNPTLQAKFKATDTNDVDMLYPGNGGGFTMLNMLMPGQTAGGQASFRDAMAKANIGNLFGRGNTNTTPSASARPAPRAHVEHPHGTCGNCGAEDTDGQLLKCGRCKKAVYCGKECQKEHWKNGGHKEACKA